MPPASMPVDILRGLTPNRWPVAAADKRFFDAGNSLRPWDWARRSSSVVKVWLHSTGVASPPAALLLAQILPVFSVVAPCRRGASPVSVRRQTFTTDC